MLCSMSATTAGNLPGIDQPGASGDFVVITLLMTKTLSQIKRICCCCCRLPPFIMPRFYGKEPKHYK